ncbi:UNVERIFIED_CONTAM: putative protein phosphatase 2C 22 [Sesamum angustifolium]|uniref:PPM-type phosphatase domain-containing protein n=1 Tax=Sesamum angustifolium TaxID=2727405 RepID=A0AAW2MJT2_9LAMI
MEGSRVISNNVDGSRENCSSADGRPPIPNSIGGRGAYRHSFNSNGTTPLCTKSLVRHPSLVFDGHGGKHAADFACYHLPRFIVEDEDFPQEIERVMSSAFLQTDTAFAEALLFGQSCASGTTALAAVVIGSSLVVANAGDCRAVLCRRGKAIEMSRDHKPVCLRERRRIEASGGYVYDGYLNGQLNVARALGRLAYGRIEGQDGGPLTAEPELMSTKLTEEDEFPDHRL